MKLKKSAVIATILVMLLSISIDSVLAGRKHKKKMEKAAAAKAAAMAKISASTTGGAAAASATQPKPEIAKDDGGGGGGGGDSQKDFSPAMQSFIEVPYKNTTVAKLCQLIKQITNLNNELELFTDAVFIHRDTNELGRLLQQPKYSHYRQDILDALLYASVILEDVDATRILMRCGANPDIDDIDGNTCLHKLAVTRNIVIARILLKEHSPSSASLTRRNIKQQTPLYLAILNLTPPIVDTHTVALLLLRSMYRSDQPDDEALELAKKKNEENQYALKELVQAIEATKSEGRDGGAAAAGGQ